MKKLLLLPILIAFAGVVLPSDVGTAPPSQPTNWPIEMSRLKPSNDCGCLDCECLICECGNKPKVLVLNIENKPSLRLLKGNASTRVEVSPIPEPIKCCGLQNKEEQTVSFQTEKPKVDYSKKGRGHKKMTKEKFDRLHTENIKRHGPIQKRFPKATPATYDCTTLGYVTPPWNQGQCGSCWDFSGSEIVTFSYIKAGWFPNDGSFEISPQYTLDCYQNGGCNGDDNTTVLAQALSAGLPTTADYGAYVSGGSGNTQKCKFKAGTKLYKIADWGFCTASNQQGVASTQDIKNALVAKGPIGTGVDASQFNNYTTGIISGNNNSTNIDHDVVIVAWDDTKGTAGCWKVLNSWGDSWGISGYCWMEYTSYGIGTEAVWCDAPPAPNAAKPMVNSLNPTFGIPSGMTTTVITGSGFTGVTGVSFGTVPASSFTFNSDTQVTAISPAGSGVVDVTVTTATATSVISTADQFTYSATPPTPVPTPGGITTVTVTGPSVVGGTITGELVQVGGNAAISQVISKLQAITLTSAPTPPVPPTPPTTIEQRLEAVEKNAATDRDYNKKTMASILTEITKLQQMIGVK